VNVAVYSPSPLEGAMASPAIRLHHVARELGARGHDVAVVGPPDDDLDRFDAVVAGQLPPHVALRLRGERTRVVHDLYTPTLPEALASLAAGPADRARVALVRAELVAERIALATGDAFICTNERQRDFWIGVLGTLGRIDLATYRRDRTLRDVIDVVPFGVPPERPVGNGSVLRGVIPGIAVTDRVLLWLGGIVDWTDAVTVVQATARLARQRSDVRLVFVGGALPGVEPSAAERAARATVDELGVRDRLVFFLDVWVPYDQRASYLLDADVGVVAYRDSFEARLAHRARLLDHVWASLPTLTTMTDELGELVERERLGRAVAPGDVDAYAAAVADVLDHPPSEERFERLRGELSWARAIQPLERLLTGAASPPTPRLARLRLRSNLARARSSYELRGAGGVLRRQLRNIAGRGR
jgi:glycosyltransferase involved in cell wall biosynthesis